MLLPLLFLLAAAPLFDYDRSRPLDVRQDIQVRDISFANLSGGRTQAYVVRPAKKGRYAGVLFVHWYEPESADSNRTQFLQQATELARHGTVSLLVETMWSDPKWFLARDPSADYANSVKQVKELRRALDVLLADPEVDPNRVAYVGHDFGAMYGAVLSGVDRRPKAWALQAGTTSFSDWYLLARKLDQAGRKQVVDELAPLNPVKFIASAAPAPVFLQFGRKDKYVPEAKAQEFFEAAKEPKRIEFYDAGHALNQQAIDDRQPWLIQVLKLP